MAWRLNSAAEEADLKQVDIAARLGEKPATVGNWFQGLNFPRAARRRQLAALLGVSEEWLFEGSPEKKAWAVEESPLAATEYTAVRQVPVISWAHAGAAANFEAMPKHWQGQVYTTSRDKKAFGLTVEGDSMEPKFYPGDRVILEPSRQPRNGKPVVVKFADDAIQLRIYTKLPNGMIRLTPYNPIYQSVDHSPKELSWIWPVCELSRTV